MAELRQDPRPEVARVDQLIDENASPIPVAEDSALRVATAVEQNIGATGPTNWWRLGLIGLSIVVAILLLLQVLNGAPGTAVVPGTPVSAPAVPPA